MNLAGTRRLALRLHHGEIDETRRAYAEHLERVAALVASYGGDEVQQMAAWLHGIGRTGLAPRDLAALGVPGRVVQIVAALTPAQPWEPAGARAARVRACRTAAVVLRADVADLARPQAQAAWGSRWRYRAAELGCLLDLSGVPVPEDLDGVDVAGSRADVAGLLSSLDPDSPGRWAAVAALGECGDLCAAGALADAYLAGAAGDPRWAAGQTQLRAALARIACQTRRADSIQEAWLVSLAAQHDAFLRATAIRCLAGLGGHDQLIVTALSDDSPLVVDAALASIDSAEGLAGTLAQIAGRLDRGWTRPRRRAVRLLAKAGDRGARAVLVPALAADGMGLGADVINSVLAWQDHDSVTAVLARLVRSGARGRAAAAYLLGELRAGQTAGDLIAALAQDPADADFRVACIEALGKLADPAAVHVLASQAGHRYPWVRVSALIALSRIDHPDVATIALAAADDFDPDVRDRAIRVLAASGGRDATARLLACCDGPLAPVALRGLARIGDERAVASLTRLFLTTQDRRVRHLAGRALARSARRAPSLYLASAATPAQARAAAWVLGEIGDKDSYRTLTTMLTHRDALVRARAAAALGRVASPEAAPALRAALADISPAVRAAAVTSLGRLGVADAATWLEACLADSHPAVRSAAQAAIRRADRGAPRVAGVDGSRG
jgi:HEAT repeat protein